MKMAMLVSALTKQQMWQLPMCCSRFLPLPPGKDYQKVDDIPERSNIDKDLKRTTPFLTHEVFSKYHTETEMMRYIKRLDRKDISLAQSMISLGSCTMKLNAAAEMLPLSRPEFMGMHPLVPEDQAEGYRELIKNLSEDLKVITGFAGVSLQPNSGAAGEYAGASCDSHLSRKYRSGTP